MATDELAELRARVAALEQASMPSYTPLTGLKVAADGSTTYDFDGHVHARGLDLDAALVATPPEDRKVRWVSTVDGAVVAELGGYELSGGGPASSTGAFLQAKRGSNAASVVCQAAPGGGLTELVRASAGTAGASIIRADDQSSFLRGQQLAGDAGTVGAGVNLWGGVTFNLPHRAEALLIVVSASGYVAAGPAATSWLLLFDGASIGGSGFLFNNGGVHHQLGTTVALAFNVAPGNHTIQLSNPASPLVVDANDNCSWFVIG